MFEKPFAAYITRDYCSRDKAWSYDDKMISRKAAVQMTSLTVCLPSVGVS